MVDVAFAETLEAQSSMRWDVWDGQPGVFSIGHSVYLYMTSDNSGVNGFSGEADFFRQMPVPEPATWVLLLGALAMGGNVLRRMRLV